MITERANDLYSIMWKNTNGLAKTKILNVRRKEQKITKKRRSVSILTSNTLLFCYSFPFPFFFSFSIFVVVYKNVAHKHLKSLQRRQKSRKVRKNSQQMKIL